MVQVEMAGKRTPPTVRLVPDDIRRVAAYIIETCALERGGPTGGFGTGNLEDMKQWLATDGISLDHSIRKSSTSERPFHFRKAEQLSSFNQKFTR